MKAVLIGADLMYRQDGKIVPIEINTNTAWDSENRLEESLDDVFDFDTFKAFLDKHNIEEIWVDGLMSGILTKFYSDQGLKVESKTEEELAEAEDRDGLLLLRTSYSDEALVDAFCRDKSIFLEAVKDLEAGCEYILKDSVASWRGEIKNLPDNGDYPNLIVKYRYPYYDRRVYPKLVKVSSQEELRALLESDEVPENYLVMPFYFNENNLYKQEGEERLKLLRHFSMFALVDGALEAVPVGIYTKLCGNLEGLKCEYSELGVLDTSIRNAFLNYWVQVGGEDILAEAGDLVLMSDDTWKPVEELAVGDLVKSLDVPSKDADIKKHTEDYNVPLEELEADSSFSSNRVVRILQKETVTTVVAFKFADGTDWQDTVNSSYPTIDPKDGTVWFRTLDMLKVGDKIILLEANNLEKPTFSVKEITEIERKRKIAKGFGLTLDGSHLFITKSPGESEAYVAIEHNADTAECDLPGSGSWICSCSNVSSPCNCSKIVKDGAAPAQGTQPSGTYPYCVHTDKVTTSFQWDTCQVYSRGGTNQKPNPRQISFYFKSPSTVLLSPAVEVRDIDDRGWYWNMNKGTGTGISVTNGVTFNSRFTDFWVCSSAQSGRVFIVKTYATDMLTFSGRPHVKIDITYALWNGNDFGGDINYITREGNAEDPAVSTDWGASGGATMADYVAGAIGITLPYLAVPSRVSLEITAV